MPPAVEAQPEVVQEMPAVHRLLEGLCKSVDPKQRPAMGKGAGETCPVGRFNNIDATFEVRCSCPAAMRLHSWTDCRLARTFYAV